MNRIHMKATTFIPTFNGRHNKIKAMCWLLLYDRYLGNQRGLKLAELAELTGFSYKSLSVLISRWLRWKFIGFPQRPGRREYHLLRRGIAWIDRWRDIMPLDDYIRELEEIQSRGYKKSRRGKSTDPPPVKNKF